MPVISDKEIAQYARDAGLPGDKIPLAVSIALAESGGDTTAGNRNTNGSTDTGLWQINSVHGIPVSELRDPKANAKAMAKISDNGKNWKPWTAYKTGAHTKFWARGLKAAEGTGGGTNALKSTIDDPGGALAAVAATNPIEALADVLQSFGEAIGRLITFVTDPNTWKRVALVVGGLGVVYVAAGTIIRPYTDKATQPVKKVVTKGLA